MSRGNRNYIKKVENPAVIENILAVKKSMNLKLQQIAHDTGVTSPMCSIISQVVNL